MGCLGLEGGGIDEEMTLRWMADEGERVKGGLFGAHRGLERSQVTGSSIISVSAGTGSAHT